MSKDVIIYKIKESILGSIVSDSYTFGCLAFCIWLSAGSRFWTLVCFCMLVIFVLVKMLVYKQSIRFNSDADLMEYLKNKPYKKEDYND